MALSAAGHLHLPAQRVGLPAQRIEIVAALAGVPLYVNGAGVVPIAEALWSKGMPLGTVMAFTMSAIALSIPQAVMLRRVLRPPLLAAFFGAWGGRHHRHRLPVQRPLPVTYPHPTQRGMPR